MRRCTYNLCHLLMHPLTHSKCSLIKFRPKLSCFLLIGGCGSSCNQQHRLCLLQKWFLRYSGLLHMKHRYNLFVNWSNAFASMCSYEIGNSCCGVNVSTDNYQTELILASSIFFRLIAQSRETQSATESTYQTQLNFCFLISA